MRTLINFLHRALLLTLLAPASFATVTILTHPSDQVVEAGTSVTYTVAATTANGPLTYQWDISFDGSLTWTALADDAVFSGTTTRSLTRSSATLDLDGAYFRYTVSDPVSGQSSGRRLYVIRDLAWDPGATDLGTEVFSVPPENLARRDYFKLTTEATSVGAWRTALRVATGTADIFLKQNSAPTSTSHYAYKSDRAGVAGDGFVVPSASCEAAQTWYPGTSLRLEYVTLRSSSFPARQDV